MRRIREAIEQDRFDAFAAEFLAGPAGAPARSRGVVTTTE